MCLLADGIDHNDGGIGRLRRAKGLSDDDGGVFRGRGIRDASKGLETTTESAVARQQSQGIFDNGGGVKGGI